jgi:hypothetical protein
MKHPGHTYGGFVPAILERGMTITQGFPLLLPATLQNPGIVRPQVCALKVAGEDLLEFLPTIDRVSGQVIERSSERVDQVNGEELDNEEVIVCPAREAVVLQPNPGIGFAAVLDDIVGHPKMLREACVTHVAPKRFRP